MNATISPLRRVGSGVARGGQPAMLDANRAHARALAIAGGRVGRAVVDDDRLRSLDS